MRQAKRIATSRRNSVRWRSVFWVLLRIILLVHLDNLTIKLSYLDSVVNSIGLENLIYFLLFLFLVISRLFGGIGASLN